jgi:hypothetical protein
MLISLRYRFRIPLAPADRNWHRRPFPVFPEQAVFGTCDAPPVLIHRNDPVPLMLPAVSADRDAVIIDEIPDSFSARWMKECVVTFTVDENGQVVFPGFPHRFNRRMSAEPRRAILDSVRQWRFLPAMRNGQAVSILVAQRVEYLYP